MAALNETQTDIRPFINSGGKLIVWHGGSDTALSVNSTIEYMANVTKSFGAANASASIRFCVALGVNHCAGGVGPDRTIPAVEIREMKNSFLSPCNRAQKEGVCSNAGYEER